MRLKLKSLAFNFPSVRDTMQREILDKVACSHARLQVNRKIGGDKKLLSLLTKSFSSILRHVLQLPPKTDDSTASGDIDCGLSNSIWTRWGEGLDKYHHRYC
eukprot:SAG31_NODE_256_length_19032_cov_5.305181_8_plen_102_part_00